MTIGIIEAKKFIRGIGYVEPLHKVNLFLIDGSYVLDYEPCNFLRGVIETGVIENLLELSSAFNTLSIINQHPFSKFIESTKLYGDKLSSSTPDQIIDQYEQWFDINKNQFSEWC